MRAMPIHRIIKQEIRRPKRRGVRTPQWRVVEEYALPRGLQDPDLSTISWSFEVLLRLLSVVTRIAHSSLYIEKGIFEKAPGYRQVLMMSNDRPSDQDRYRSGFLCLAWQEQGIIKRSVGKKNPAAFSPPGSRGPPLRRDSYSNAPSLPVEHAAPRNQLDTTRMIASPRPDVLPCARMCIREC